MTPERAMLIERLGHFAEHERIHERPLTAALIEEAIAALLENAGGE